MAKDITDISLFDLLPSSISDDEQIRSIVAAIDPLLKQSAYDAKQFLINSRIDELPEPVLDLLAWQWHVDFYEPLDLSLKRKRKLLKESLGWHRIKGTPEAVRLLCQAVYTDAYIEEWYKYGGRPYFFRMTLDISDSGDDVDAITISRLKRAISLGKNVRSWLDYFNFIWHTEDDVPNEDARPEFDATLAGFSDIVPYGTSIRRRWLPRYDGRWRYDGKIKYFPYAELVGWDDLFLAGNLTGFYDDYSLGFLRYNGKARYNSAIRYGPNALPADLGICCSQIFKISDSVQQTQDATPLGDALIKLADAVPYGRHRGLAQYDGSKKYDGGARYAKPSDLEHDCLTLDAALLFSDDYARALLRYDKSIRYNGAAKYGWNILPIDAVLFVGQSSLTIEDDVKVPGESQASEAAISFSDTIPYNNVSSRLSRYDGRIKHDGRKRYGRQKELAPEYIDIQSRLVFADDVSKDYIRHDGTRQYNGTARYGVNAMPADAKQKMSALLALNDTVRAPDESGGLSISYLAKYSGRLRYDGSVRCGQRIAYAVAV